MMDARRLVRSGKTSYTLALPIEWVKRNRLDRGDTVFVDEKENQLVITMAETPDISRNATVTVEKKTLLALEAEVFRHYASGATHITFSIAAREPGLQKVEQVMQKFPGFELDVRTDSKVTYKDLFASNLLVTSELLRKQEAFLRAMVFELAERLQSMNRQATLASIATYYVSLRRQHLLLHRQVLRRAMAARESTVTLLVARSLLRLGDLLKDFLASLNLLDEDQVLHTIIPEYARFKELYGRVMRSLFTADTADAVKNRERLALQVESMRAKIRGTSEQPLLLGFEYLLNMYGELSDVSELAGLVTDA